MDLMTTDALIELSLQVLFYFIVGTLGAFTKDMYETMTKKIEKIRLGEVLVGGIVATIICYGLSDTWFKDFSLNTLFLVTFILGVLGFEIFGNMTNIANIRNLLVIIEEIRRGVASASPTNIPPNIDPTDKSEPINVSQSDETLPTVNNVVEIIQENNKEDIV